MRLGLVLGEALNGLRRNASMVVSVVLVTFISLTFVGVAILLQTQIGSMRAYWYDRSQVAIYLCSAIDETGNCLQAAATEEELAAVQAALVAEPLVDFVERSEYLSPQEVYTTALDQYADNPMATFLTPDLLGGIIRVTLYDPADADVVIESISGFAGVQSVEDQRAYLEPIFALLGAASAAAIGVAGLMLVAAVLLIATTIRLSAFSRRRELGIMRLVGASNRFIETPFVLEGVIAALVGSLLAGGAVVAIVQFFVGGTLGAAVGGSALLVGVSDALAVAPVLVLIGVVLAGLSASIAIRRYLKV